MICTASSPCVPHRWHRASTSSWCASPIPIPSCTSVSLFGKPTTVSPRVNAVTGMAASRKCLSRFLHDVLLLDGKEALPVNWFEITVINTKTGEQLYHNSFITNHQVTADNVAEAAQAGRGRWKIANENNNILKTKGYHVAHNFGHGQQYLAAIMLSLNLIAFLFHTVLEWSDAEYTLLRQVLARRQTFFED